MAGCAETFPAGSTPGQRRISGTRMPPSQSVPFRWKNGAFRDSHSPPLSLVKMTSVLRASPSFSSVPRIRPTP